MKSITIPYRQENHGSFDQEWPVQRGVSGRWTITGYFSDIHLPGRLFSYRFAVIRLRLFGISAWILQLALTDVSTGRHEFTQRLTLHNPDVFVSEDAVHFGPLAHLQREEKSMRLTVRADAFDLDLILDKGKAATWHGDDGVLVMGNARDPRRRTVYYSYTNMPTRGRVMRRGGSGGEKVMRVAGKSWFDRQWGPFKINRANTHWEWFSLRFFDDEEVMLFAFPQCPYYDGTHVDAGGRKRLVRDYILTPRGFCEAGGLTFPMGWDLYMPGIREEKYAILPLTDGQLNLAHYELIAGIVDRKGKRVGLCMVELLPGARNPQRLINILDLFRKV